VKLTRARPSGEDGDSGDMPDASSLLSNIVALAGFVTKIELLSLAAVFLAAQAFSKKGFAGDTKNIIMGLTLGIFGALSTIFQEGMNRAREAQAQAPAS